MEIDEETKNAWEKLKKKSKKEIEEAEALLSGMTEEGKTGEGKIEGTVGSSKEKAKAAEWLTGGLEEEVMTRAEAPVLPMQAIQPIASLEEVAEFPSRERKEGEGKETRPYETGARPYETRGEREEIYEETSENLFNRMVRPLDITELRQDIPRVRLPVPQELRGIEAAREQIVKYVERRDESSELPFMKKGIEREDIQKYKKKGY